MTSETENSNTDVKLKYTACHLRAVEAIAKQNYEVHNNNKNRYRYVLMQPCMNH